MRVEDERVTAMQRVRLRRFVLVAALAVLAGSGLAGCQNQPGTAGYVGDVRFTDADVETSANQVQADVANSHPGSAFRFGDLRSYLLQRKVLNELLKRYASEQHVTVGTIDYAGAAQTIGLPEDDEVVRLSAEEDAYVMALVNAAEPVKPTEADLREIYDKADAATGGNIGSFDQVKSSIAAYPKLGNALAVRAALTDAAKRYGVGISPRYGAADLPLLQTTGTPQVELVGVTIGSPAGTPAVSDLPTTPPTG
jgi:hypothetical protein